MDTTCDPDTQAGLYVVNPKTGVVTVPDSTWTIQFNFQARDGEVSIDSVNRMVTAPEGYRLWPADGSLGEGAKGE